MAFVLAAAVSAGWSACALQGYPDGKLSIVTEPGEDSSYLHYYAGGEEKSVSDIVWEDGGHTGKAVSLTGEGEYLQLNYNQLQMHTMTFAGWFYLRGAAQGQDTDSLYRQRLFTLSHSDAIWLTVMPHAKNASQTDSDGKIMDGVYMGFAYNSKKIDLYNPAEPDRESYGLPLNEWHFVAVTMDGQKLKLYIDGRLWLEDTLVLGVEEMKNNTLTIGSGRWGDPTLNALVDDTAMYDFAMSADQVAMLDAGVDPLAGGASLPATTAPSLPSAPTEPQTAATGAEESGFLSVLPVWSFYLMGGVLLVFISASVILSFYKPAPPSGSSKSHSDKPNGTSGKGGGRP